MRSAALDLAKSSEASLFEAVADGVPLILENAQSLEAAARRLYSAEEYRASDIICGFAEEEAAKILILLDAVRCPRAHREETLKCFNNHLAKRIYSLSCSYPNIASFGELGDFIALERQPFYLDGPNSVDWIFANSITTRRERAIYVDYAQDITDVSGSYAWIGPELGRPMFPMYRPPESVELCRALSDAGANFAEGVATIADVWRGFLPDKGTSRDELQELIERTLEALSGAGHSGVDRGGANRIVTSWSFPLWPFGLSRKPPGRTVDELRQDRKRTIEWIERTEARREPPPSIEQAKVEAMGEAYWAWRAECDAEDSRSRDGKGTSSSLNDLAARHELRSYRRLKEMFAGLEESERAALLALAWFAQETVADWPGTYERARSGVGSLGWTYQIGKGWYWLAGFARWQAEPRAYQAGRLSSDLESG